jgi:hypothetical protein
VVAVKLAAVVETVAVGTRVFVGVVRSVRIQFQPVPTFPDANVRVSVVPEQVGATKVPAAAPPVVVPPEHAPAEAVGFRPVE